MRWDSIAEQLKNKNLEKHDEQFDKQLSPDGAEERRKQEQYGSSPSRNWESEN